MKANARSPFGLALLALSVAAAAGVALHDQWSERAWWVLAWGCAMYAVTLALSGRPAPAPVRPERLPALPPEQFLRLTEEGLRCLNNPAALARCELAAQVPATLGSVLKRSPKDPAATPLELAHAMRDILLQAIERLRPAGNDARPGTQANLLYQVIHDEIVLERPNASIMGRLSISERTFYRYRREGVNAVARELWFQERKLSEN